MTEMTDTATKPRISWRRQKSETGLARACQGPRGWELWADGKCHIHIAYIRRDSSRLYWYGFDKNTSDAPVDTLEEAKTQAKAYFLEKTHDLR